MISPHSTPDDPPPANPILQPLNPAQRAGVTQTRGPLLVIAGAGSGKTRMITHRIAHLIQQGVPADGILAITFTNKAAREMQKRVEELMGVKSPWISTFHSFGARILRRHLWRFPPYSSAFTIYDQEDGTSLLKEIIHDLELEKTQWSPRSFSGHISRLKNRGVIDPSELPAGGRYFDQILHKVFARYQKGLEERNALDFDDLLLFTVRLFTEHSDILERYQEQFQYVLVDEYQDTNLVQYRICSLLARKGRNLCVTGDPDQSIYSWRGADQENLRRFEADFPEANTVTLDQNYRSTRKILRAANAVIRHDRDRKPKDLWSENSEGDPVRVRRFPDGERESAAIAREIQKLRQQGVSGGEISIFYRINSLSREVERAMIYAGIPYVVVGGVEFFQRREIKDMVAYLRILANPRDSESLKRIINVPPRKIGPGALNRLAERSREHGISLLAAALDPALRSSLPTLTRRALEGFATLYRSLAELPRSPVAGLIKRVLDLTDYQRYLLKTEGEEAEERLRNVGELVNAAAEFDSSRPPPAEGSPREETGPGAEDGDSDLEGFLAEVALLSSVDRWERGEDRVALMTLHSAKGLEFQNVFIVGLETGILPLMRGSPSEADPADIAEERRLLYVGITRAKERLWISHVHERLRFGRFQTSVPSEFLSELVDPDSESGVELDESTELHLRGGTGRRLVANEDFYDGDGDEFDWAGGCDEDPFPAGARVAHGVYGHGTVVRGWGSGRMRRVTVRFDQAGEKQLVLSYAKLQRL